MALSGIASDDCHVTTETQLEEVEKRKPGPLWGSASSNQKKAAGAEILFYVPFPHLGLWGELSFNSYDSCLLWLRQVRRDRKNMKGKKRPAAVTVEVDNRMQDASW